MVQSVRFYCYVIPVNIPVGVGCFLVRYYFLSLNVFYSLTYLALSFMPIMGAGGLIAYLLLYPIPASKKIKLGCLTGYWGSFTAYIVITTVILFTFTINPIFNIQLTHIITLQLITFMVIYILMWTFAVVASWHIITKRFWRKRRLNIEQFVRG